MTSGLPARGNSLDQIFFGLGQIEAGAVAAGKAGLAHRHLFAFESAGDADDGNDDIGILRGRDCRRIGHVVHGSPQMSCASGLPSSDAAVADLELYRMTFFEVNRGPDCVLAPERRNLSVHPLTGDAKPSTLKPKQIVAGCSGVERSRPLHRQAVFLSPVRGHCSAFRFTDGSTREVSGVGLASKLGRELYSALRPGLPSGVVSTDAGTGSALLRKKLRAGDVSDLRVGNSAFIPSSTLTVCVGVPL